MLQHDKLVMVGGLPVASYGPRVEREGVIEDIAPELAQFWGVYLHDSDGLARQRFDVDSEANASRMARALGTIGEPLTVAFMALGAAEFIAPAPNEHAHIGLDAMAEIVSCAPIIDTLVRGVELDFTFAYSLARPYGYALAEAYATGKLDGPTALRIARECLADANS